MIGKALLLSTSLGMGGADRQILYLTRALLSHGYDVRLVSMTALAEMGLQAATDGLPVSSLDMQRGKADWASFQRFIHLLQDWKPHLLTSFMYHANLLGRLAGKKAGVPLIVTSIRSERNGGSGRDWLMRITNWMDHCCTTNSQEVADSLLHRRLVARGKLRVIPNGVDITAFLTPPEVGSGVRKELGVSDGEFLWVAIGRLLPQKDYPNLLQAFQLMAPTSARLAIVGRGPLQDLLEQQVTQLGLDGKVTFMGVRRDVPALLAAADGFVLSSAWEGMPNVVMEAMAAGTPVVATRVGGVPELVDPGRSGFLAPPEDPVALAGSMRQLMLLPDWQRKAMGLHGRQHVTTRYGMGAMAERWIHLYEELLIAQGVAPQLPAKPAIAGTKGSEGLVRKGDR